MAAKRKPVAADGGGRVLLRTCAVGDVVTLADGRRATLAWSTTDARKAIDGYNVRATPLAGPRGEPEWRRGDELVRVERASAGEVTAGGAGDADPLRGAS